jgi:hypothetical protein
MAHALGQVVVKVAQENEQFIFDGLRGLNEVQHGSSYFPRSRFIVLEAPDVVRLNRLLNRGDQFDVVDELQDLVVRCPRERSHQVFPLYDLMLAGS